MEQNSIGMFKPLSGLGDTHKLELMLKGATMITVHKSKNRLEVASLIEISQL